MSAQYVNKISVNFADHVVRVTGYFQSTSESPDEEVYDIVMSDTNMDRLVEVWAQIKAKVNGEGQVRN